MRIQNLVTAAVLVVLTTSTAWAAAKDYRFELVAPPAAGNKSTIKIKLVHVPEGKPVRGAVIFETRFDMAPDGMGMMTAPAKLASETSEPGVYLFELEPSMAGRWALTLSAKVQGETETVRDTVIVTVPK